MAGDWDHLVPPNVQGRTVDQQETHRLSLLIGSQPTTKQVALLFWRLHRIRSFYFHFTRGIFKTSDHVYVGLLSFWRINFHSFCSNVQQYCEGIFLKITAWFLGTDHPQMVLRGAVGWLSFNGWLHQESNWNDAVENNKKIEKNTKSNKLKNKNKTTKTSFGATFEIFHKWHSQFAALYLGNVSTATIKSIFQLDSVNPNCHLVYLSVLRLPSRRAEIKRILLSV